MVKIRIRLPRDLLMETESLQDKTKPEEAEEANE